MPRETWRKTLHLRPESDPHDMVLRNAKVFRLHDWLRSYLEFYVGLYEAGSLAAGEPWIEGRSDRDILVVLDGAVTSDQRSAMTEQLRAIGFGDTYLFNLAQKRGFLQTNTHHDIAMKFRGVALFGEDLIAQKETPPRAYARSWADEGLKTMPSMFRNRALNAGSWSLERSRDEIYSDLKLMFLFLADKTYAETGYYPRRRLDVADAYDSVELRRLAVSLTTIDEADKQSLIQTAESAVGVLQQLLR